MLQAHIIPRVRDLGDGFKVRRALPDAARRNVGPFVFFDQMGPVTIPEGAGLDVRFAFVSPSPRPSAAPPR